MTRNEKISWLVLRFGLAVTFVLIGIFILRDPISWTGYISPWAIRLLPVAPEKFMFWTGVLDVLLGIGFLVPSRKIVKIVSLVAVLHLVSVLIGSGINNVTVRDVGLLGASVAIFLTFRKGNNERFMEKI